MLCTRLSRRCFLGGKQWNFLYLSKDKILGLTNFSIKTDLVVSSPLLLYCLIKHTEPGYQITDLTPNTKIVRISRITYARYKTYQVTKIESEYFLFRFWKVPEIPKLALFRFTFPTRPVPQTVPVPVKVLITI